MAGRGGALYCSREAHYSVVRAAELLGIGSDLVRALPQDAERRVLPEEVAHAIDRDVAAGVAPIAVVATAGTTLTGAVDPIAALADVCAERGTWLHVDGAYGVAAASTPSAGHLFAGLERADSVTARRAQVALPAEGVRRRARPPPRGPPRRARPRGGLRPARSARPSHGRHHARVLASVPRAQALAGVPRARRGCDPGCDRAEPPPGAACCTTRSRRRDDFELLCGEPPLSVVPFRHARRCTDLTRATAASSPPSRTTGASGWRPPRVDGASGLRPCVVNYRTTDDDIRALVTLARDAGRTLAAVRP